MFKAKYLPIIGYFLVSSIFASQEDRLSKDSCHYAWKFTKHVCQRWHQIWNKGKAELYFSGYAWHNRYTYSREKIKTFNENAWGGGLGKGFYDEDGDWHGLSAVIFLDSHKNIEPAAGYTFLKMAHLNDNIEMGVGYSILVTARSDIIHNIPFPGMLPWISFGYRKLTLLGTYLPGSKGAGNVFYILGKWTL